MKLVESEQRVASDGTVTIHDLVPGAIARVIVVQRTDQARVVDPEKYRRDDFEIERPFDPACDPDDWDALR